MQKKIIALAVAGLVSGAAFAQSNVTVYGLVDVGYSHRSDNVVAGVNSRSGVDSGIQSGNRLGFKGTEDLGGGLKAGFVLEAGFQTDTGVYNTNGATGVGFGRQAYASLSGGFGTVAAGRMYTPQFSLVAGVDPFGYGLTGNIANVYQNTARLDNVAAYVSPDFGGLNVVVAYTPNAGGNEVADDTAAVAASTTANLVTGAVTTVAAVNPNTRVWALAPTFKSGPMMAGLNYHNIKTDNAAFSTKVWDLGGTYDFGMAKLHALYGRDSDINAARDDRKKYMLGVSVGAGANGRVLLSYTNSKTDTAAVDPKSRQVAIGYTHNLSKRTNLHVSYSDINNDNGAVASVGDSSNGGAGYQQGFALGMRHTF